MRYWSIMLVLFMNVVHASDVPLDVSTLCKAPDIQRCELRLVNNIQRKLSQAKLLENISALARKAETEAAMQRELAKTKRHKATDLKRGQGQRHNTAAVATLVEQGASIFVQQSK